MKDAKGRFVVGNVYHTLRDRSVPRSFAKKLRKELQADNVYLIIKYLKMNYGDLKEMLQRPEAGLLTNLEMMIIQVIIKTIETSDIKIFKQLLNMVGVVTDVKPVEPQDVQGDDDQDEESEMNQDQLTKAEQIKMLDEMKSILESSKP